MVDAADTETIAEPLGDEELAVLRESGEVWNKDLPHTRDACGEVPFVVGKVAANKKHCEKCYCWVCDCLASDCGFWGDGTAFSNHCNAHGDSDQYHVMRRQRINADLRRKQLAGGDKAAEAGMQGVLAGAAAAAMSSTPGALAAAARRLNPFTKAAPHAPSLPPPPPPPPPCTLKPIPSPVDDRDLMLLARVELEVKALRSNSIASLRERLVPTGYYVPPDSSAHEGRKLTINSLFEKQWDQAARKYNPVHLKFKKLKLQEDAPELTNSRLRKVTILHYDGRAKPTTYGLEVGKEATVQEIMDAAAPLAGLDPACEQFIAMNGGHGSGSSHLGAHFVEASRMVSDRSLESLRLALWRVPKPAGKPSDPNYAVVFHRKHTGLDCPLWEGVGYPTLVPINKNLAQGGTAAARTVLESVVQALAPLLREPEGAPPVAQAAKLLMSAGVHLIRTSPHGCAFTMSDSTSEFSVTKPYDSSMRYGERFFREGYIFLRLDWKSAELAAYDTAAWDSAVTDASASEEAMQPTRDAIKLAEAWASKRAHAAELPYSVLEELKAASRSWEPGVQYPLVRAAARVDPLARVVVDLVPSSSDKGEKKGTIVFAVYVWRGDRGVPHRAFFRPSDEWESGRSSRHTFVELGCNPLKSMMEVVLWADEAHRERKARIREWAEKDAACVRSIQGLMKALERGEMPAAQQPAGLTVTMRPYQLQSLQFMLDGETGEGGFRRLFWQQLQTPGGTRYWWSVLLGRASLEVPAQGWGGWCAEEMGLGKTIEVLGLILANPAPPLPEWQRRKDGSVRTHDNLICSRATLVVCAVSLVGQWVAEAQAKTGGSLKIHMYHGQDRCRDPIRLANQFDLVVTTYSTLSADFGGKRGNAAPNFPPLGAIKWHRLVLDEAHTVKNSAVGHSKASIALKAERRWLCTGTPINTDVGDLYGQFCVLGLAPFNSKTFFDANIKPAFGNHVFGGSNVPLMYTLGQTMIRHTKQQVLGGEEVLRLPPKTEETVPVVLTASEQEMYRKAHAASAALFAQYRDLGNATINKHLLQIMALLLPMRRVCSGGTLKRRDLEVNDPLFGEGAEVRRRRLEGGGGGGGGGTLTTTDHSLVAPEEECPVCMDMLEAPSMTPCLHWFCRECIMGVLAANPKCPLCRRCLNAGELRLGITAAEADAEEAAAEAAAAASAAAAAAAAAGGAGEAAAGGGGGGGEAGEQAPAVPPAEAALVSDSKLQALLKELRHMRRANPQAKALIFSQYVSTIEWLKTALTAAGFGYRFISGSMPLKQRAKAINAFQQDPPTTVFLLSMRAGAVGINLTAATHVFLMEPALNPALEDQAIGRAWRMGQKNCVTVKKFYVKGSVEERIMEVVKQRKEAVGGAATAAGSAASTAAAAAEMDDEELHAAAFGRGRGGHGRSNVRMQDLVGSIQTDRQNLRVGELEILFQEPDLGDPRVPEPESEEEEEEEEEAAANRPGSSAAHAALRGSGKPTGRKRGRPAKKARSVSSSEGGSPAFAAATAAAAAGGRSERLGRGARRPVRSINYAELEAGKMSDEEGAEEEEAGLEGGQQRAAVGGGEEDAPGSAQRSGAAAGRGKRQQRMADSDNDEWDAAQEEEEEEEEEEDRGSLDDSSDGGVSADSEEWWDSDAEDLPSRPSAAKRKRAGKQGQQQQQQQPQQQQMRQQVPQMEQQQQQQPLPQPQPQQQQQQQQQQEQQQQQSARKAHIHSRVTVVHPLVPIPRPGSAASSGSGRLSPGEAAGVPAPAPAQPAPAPGAAGAAGAAGGGGTAGGAARKPMRGRRSTALAAAHVAVGPSG
ncbi:hypothetical protein D9Q98_002974 [Chlorella vulgaris]|uniref:SNF2 super family n=1 Tax=Chlorella vulgaris TaxID=3077 RepID=A0A9D4Z090_CHLVU|nr:hypothetical protein D9Q98_002974 [Chlorella vulgaris]